MTITISTHATESDAIKAARQQAIEESHATESGHAHAVVLTDDGDTVTYCAAGGHIDAELRSPGWTKDGHVNVSRKIESMVY